MSYGLRHSFYKSKAWRDVKNSVWLKQSLLCNRCHKPVYVDGLSEWLPKNKRRTGIVHHKEYLNDINIYDDNVTLNEDNLEGLCKECHELEHHQDVAVRKGFMFDDEGNLILKSPPNS